MNLIALVLVLSCVAFGDNWLNHGTPLQWINGSFFFTLSTMPPKRGDRDWEESFYAMEERYRQVQKQLHDKSTELKLERVRNLKDELKSGSLARGGHGSAVRKSVTTQSARAPVARVNAVHEQSKGSLSDVVTPQIDRSSTSEQNVPVQSQPPIKIVYPITETDLDKLISHVTEPLPEELAERAALAEEHMPTRPLNDSSPEGIFSHSTHRFVPARPCEGADVDPLLMLWGHNSISAQNNALFQMNGTMKSALEDAQSQLKSCQHELANQRALCTRLQQQLDEVRIELSQTVRDRDLSAQKMLNATNTIAQQQTLLQTVSDENEKVKFNLESQLRDLRSRLTAAAENNDALSSDTRTLLTELRESGTKVAALQSKVVLLESSNAHQSNLNKSMVVELESLNHQLVAERKKMLSLARDLQSNHTIGDSKRDLEQRVGQLTQDKLALEREHLRLLADMMTLSQTTAAQARGDVLSQLEDLTAAATHWERVSALLYQDISKRTVAHSACRDECEEAKRQRDETISAAKSLRQDLALASAKLDIIWPNHVADTQHFDDIAAMRATFGRILSGRGNGVSAKLSEVLRTHNSSVLNTHDNTFSDVPSDEVVRELQAANAALFSELESMKAANEVLTDQLRMSQLSREDALLTAKGEIETLKEKGDRDYRVVSQQCDKIEFLERQVSLLRGFRVEPSIALDDLAPNEMVAELFIGQVLSANGMATAPGRTGMPTDAFPSLFCTVDFLVHETATTGVVIGYQSFFDVTMAYRFALDPLFLYYLNTRRLRVQLYERLASDTSENSCRLLGEGGISLRELVSDERQLNSQRPQLRGHVKLFRPKVGHLAIDSSFTSEAPDGEHVASVEYSVTLRVPFSAEFIRCVRSESAREDSRHDVSIRSFPTPVALYSVLERVRHVTVEFVSFVIPFTIDPVPMVSLYYAAAHAGVEGCIPPAFGVARYESHFAESDTLRSVVAPVTARPAHNGVFAVNISSPCYILDIGVDASHKDSSYFLSRALGDPITVVAFDELAPREASGDGEGSVHYWALGLVQWGSVLESAVRTPSSTALGFTEELQVAMRASDGETRGLLTVRISLRGDSGALYAPDVQAIRPIQQSIYSRGATPQHMSPNTSSIHGRTSAHDRLHGVGLSQCPSTVGSVNNASVL